MTIAMLKLVSTTASPHAASFFARAAAFLRYEESELSLSVLRIIGVAYGALAELLLLLDNWHRHVRLLSRVVGDDGFAARVADIAAVAICIRVHVDCRLLS